MEFYLLPEVQVDFVYDELGLREENVILLFKHITLFKTVSHSARLTKNSCFPYVQTDKSLGHFP